jgi:hypothetical protein
MFYLKIFQFVEFYVPNWYSALGSFSVLVSIVLGSFRTNLAHLHTNNHH